MTLNEIRQAVDAGNTVYWHDTGYEVVKVNDQYTIQCMWNDSSDLLTDEYDARDFYLSNRI